MKNIFKVSIIMLILLWTLNYAFALGNQYVKTAKLNNKAPDFSLYDLEGNRVSLSDFKDKNNVILFFWAIQCALCRKEIKYLNSINDELEARGTKVLAINVGESGNKVRRFLETNPVKFKILLDRDTETALDYDLIGVPTYVIIDKSGIIKFNGNELPSDYQELFSD